MLAEITKLWLPSRTGEEKTSRISCDFSVAWRPSAYAVQQDHKFIPPRPATISFSRSRLFKVCETEIKSWSPVG